jgi:hypothetical protein
MSTLKPLNPSQHFNLKTSQPDFLPSTGLTLNIETVTYWIDLVFTV